MAGDGAWECNYTEHNCACKKRTRRSISVHCPERLFLSQTYPDHGDLGIFVSKIDLKGSNLDLAASKLSSQRLRLFLRRPTTTRKYGVVKVDLSASKLDARPVGCVRQVLNTSVHLNLIPGLDGIKKAVQLFDLSSSCQNTPNTVSPWPVRKSINWNSGAEKSKC
eukprot:1140233-Pelagomonas_calceolata.AAC.5